MENIYNSLIIKPHDQTHEDFSYHAKVELSRYSRVGILSPVLVSSEKGLYLIRAVTKDPGEVGFNTVFPPILESDLMPIIEELRKGNLNALDSLKDYLYKNQLPNEAIIIIQPDFDEINAELIAYLSVHPELLQEMHWRKFEELLDYLFRAKGYDTELGPGSGDGGVDIRMVSKSGLGKELLTLVQAKRYAKGNKINLTPVQALYSIVNDEKANNGLFVTTSSYLPGVVKYAESRPFRLQLAGPEDIKEWLIEYTRDKK